MDLLSLWYGGGEPTNSNIVISFPHAPSVQLRIQAQVSRPSVEKAPWQFAVTVIAKWVFHISESSFSIF